MGKLTRLLLARGMTADAVWVSELEVIGHHAMRRAGGAVQTDVRASSKVWLQRACGHRISDSRTC